MQDAQHLVEEEEIDADMDLNGSGLRGPESTRSYEADSMDGGSRNVSLSGEPNMDEGLNLEGEPSGTLEWIKDVEGAEKGDPSPVKLSPFKKFVNLITPANKEKIADMPAFGLVKNRVGELEGIVLPAGEAERDRRMMESSMVRSNSMEKTMSEYRGRMSQSGEDKN